MSLKNAEKFIINCYENKDENLKNILKNIDSKFESKEAKFHYISEKAKELGYDFTPREIENSFKNSKDKIEKYSKKYQLPKNIKDTSSMSKQLLDSLY